MSGGVSLVTVSGELREGMLLASCGRRARHCPQLPVMPRAVPTTKRHPTQHVLSVDTEKPCSSPMRMELSLSGVTPPGKLRLTDRAGFLPGKASP